MKSLILPATIDSLRAVTDFVAETASAAGLSASDAYRLRQAVDEITTNIALYAYAGSAIPGSMILRSERDDALVSVTIEDTGVPFDPTKHPLPADLHLPAEQRQIGGLGVYLALKAADRFDYQRVGDRNVNVIRIFRTSAAENPRPSGA